MGEVTTQRKHLDQNAFGLHPPDCSEHVAIPHVIYIIRKEGGKKWLITLLLIRVTFQGTISPRLR